MVEQYFKDKMTQPSKSQEQGKANPKINLEADRLADLNLFIYIVIRDEKLLQLRDKIEAAANLNASN